MITLKNDAKQRKPFPAASGIQDQYFYFSLKFVLVHNALLD